MLLSVAATGWRGGEGECVRLKLADGMWVTWCGPGLTPAPAAPPPHHWLPTGRLHTGTVCTGLAHT